MLNVTSGGHQVRRGAKRVSMGGWCLQVRTTPVVMGMSRGDRVCEMQLRTGLMQSVIRVG